MAGHSRARGIRNVANWISGSCIFRQTNVIQINPSSGAIKTHILQNGAKAACCGINFRLPFGREANNFRIAAAFKIEDALIAPAMFVITDEGARWVSR